MSRVKVNIFLRSACNSIKVNARFILDIAFFRHFKSDSKEMFLEAKLQISLISQAKTL